MLLGDGALLTGLQVLNIRFQKKEERLIPGRSFCGLTYRYSGTVSVETDEVSLLSEPGTVTFIPMGQDYKTEILEDGQMIAVHFTVQDGAADLQPQLIRPDHAMGKQFFRLCELYRPGKNRDFRCMALFYEILAALEADHGSVDRSSPMRDAENYILRHFSDPELSVSAMAERLNISDSYFRREFKGLYGVSPSSFLQNIRMDHAKMLLSSGYYTIGEVARLCGFRSLSYFSAAFHRAVGMAPGEYRER